ncbi:hypothetical protein PPL_05656 [Heterostelium album PN500]|uniref:Uncharacterized protein n=1 Tax=Heterostelium pallidum (strain ATCC 26659 / Pp 5 / PN500) TaxID=670386 RepID=D3BAS5_HETP5|nr:hypothetical protein PPL_05656 [Heterostelium album PN500]EFA81662.1 hypothetical protein PPL_05656 [Heterostelium album PN500]|eukprot:XP_020433779.1 hypothetical protein PPL_05656 [Heterostelium album PN500]
MTKLIIIFVILLTFGSFIVNSESILNLTPDEKELLEKVINLKRVLSTQGQNIVIDGVSGQPREKIIPISVINNPGLLDLIIGPKGILGGILGSGGLLDGLLGQGGLIQTILTAVIDLVSKELQALLRPLALTPRQGASNAPILPFPVNPASGGIFIGNPFQTAGNAVIPPTIPNQNQSPADNTPKRSEHTTKVYHWSIGPTKI